MLQILPKYSTNEILDKVWYCEEKPNIAEHLVTNQISENYQTNIR